MPLSTQQLSSLESVTKEGDWGTCLVNENAAMAAAGGGLGLAGGCLASRLIGGALGAVRVGAGAADAQGDAAGGAALAAGGLPPLVTAAAASRRAHEGAVDGCFLCLHPPEFLQACAPVMRACNMSRRDMEALSCCGSADAPCIWCTTVLSPGGLAVRQSARERQGE